MKSCPACQRHVRATETTCPFCAVPLRELGAPMLALLGLASMLVGCSDDGLSSGSGSAGTEGTTAVSSSGDPGETVTSAAGSP